MSKPIKVAGCPVNIISNKETQTQIVNEILPDGQVVEALETSTTDLDDDVEEQSFTPSLMIPQLDIKTASSTIKNDSLMQKVNALFKTLAIEYTFFSKKKPKYNGGRPTFVVTDIQFNNGVQYMKQNLIDIIKLNKQSILRDSENNLFTEDDFTDVFTPEGCDEQKYTKIMNALEDDILYFDGHYDSSSPEYENALDVFAATFILNNFDDLFIRNMGELQGMNKKQKGLLSNTTYARKENTSKEVFWNLTDLEYGDATRHINNKAKLLVSTIPTVVTKADGTSIVNLNSFLSEKHLLNFTILMQKAVNEYNVKCEDGSGNHVKRQIQKLNLHTDPKVALYTILNLPLEERPAILKKNKLVVDSFRHYLYESSDEEYSLRELSVDAAAYGLNNCDFENIIIQEILKTSAPAYCTFSQRAGIDNNPKDDTKINFRDNVFFKAMDTVPSTLIQERAQNYVLDMQIPTLSESGKKTESPYKLTTKIIDEWKEKTAEELHRDKLFNFVFNYLFDLDYSSGDYDEFFSDKFEIKDGDSRTLTPREALFSLCETIVACTPKNEDLTTLMRKMKNANVTSIFDYEGNLERVIANIYTSFRDSPAYQFLNFLVSNTPVTHMKNDEGNSIPVYRITSAINMIDDAIDKYGWDVATEEDGREKEYNFFVKNPNVLSSYQTTYDKDTYIDQLYPGQTMIKLGAKTEQGTIEMRKASPLDKLFSSFFGSYLQSKKYGWAGFQIANYSDKPTIYDVVVNLNTDIRKEIKANSIAANPGVDCLNELLKNDAFGIQKLHFKYRQSRTLSLVSNLAQDWRNIAEKIKPELDFITLDMINYLEDAKFNIMSLHDSKWIEDHILDKARLGEIFKAIDNTIKALLGEKLDMSKRQAVMTAATELKIKIVEEASYRNYTDKHSATFGGQTFGPGPGVNRLIMNKLINELSDCKDFKKVYKERYDKMLNTEYQTTSENKITLKDALINHAEKNKFFKRDYNEYNLMSDFYTWFHLKNFVTLQFNDLFNKEAWLDPAKKSTATIQQEKSASFTTSCKRNNSYTATIAPYSQNLLGGVSPTMNVAVIDDIQLETFAPNGDSHDQDVFDGAGLTNPIQMRMQCVSLGKPNQNVLKTIGTASNLHSAQLFKWAEYAITNDAIRNNIINTSQLTADGKQFSLKKVFKRMFKSWEDNETIKSMNLLEDEGLNWVFPFLHDPNTAIFYTDGINIWRVTNIEAKTYGNYNFIYALSQEKVYVKGDELITIDGSENVRLLNTTNLYDWWEALGGEWCMEYKNDHFEYSENNMEFLYQMVIHACPVDYYDIDETIKTMLERGRSQTTIRQPLRDYFISHSIPKSAVKRGIANINNADAWSGDMPLCSFEVQTSMFGEQLDMSHETDDATIAKPSQALSALAERGVVSEEAQKVYEAMNQTIMKKLKDTDLAVYNLEDFQKQKLASRLSEELIDEIMRNDRASLSNDLVSSIVANGTEKILPFSDAAFTKELSKMIMKDLNDNLIRDRLPGSGSVLNPSSLIYQLFKVGDETFTADQLVAHARRNIYRGKFNDSLMATLASEGIETSEKTYDIIDAFNTLIQEQNYDRNDIIKYLINLQIIDQCKEVYGEDFQITGLSENNIYTFSNFKENILYGIPSNYQNLAFVGDTVYRSFLNEKTGTFENELLTLDTQKNVTKYLNDLKSGVKWYFKLNAPHDLTCMHQLDAISINDEIVTEHDYSSENNQAITDFNNDNSFSSLLAELKEDGRNQDLYCKQ